MNKAKLQVFANLQRLGMGVEDAETLVRASRRLSRFAELECNGEIQRDEKTGIPYYFSAHSGKRLGRARDTETGALKAVEQVMKGYPGLIAYHQGDPRGAAIYVVKQEDARRWKERGVDLDSVYSTIGTAVY